MNTRKISISFIMVLTIVTMMWFAQPARAAEPYGLIFNAANGRMYLDIDGDGNPANPNNTEYTADHGTTWRSAPGNLYLYGFSWTTTAPTALLITGSAHVTISLDGTNTFESTGTFTTQTYGISSSSNITVGGTGSGMLNATGGTGSAAGAHSYGIFAPTLTISDVTVNAAGGSSSVNNTSWGVYAENVTLSRGTLNAVAGTTAGTMTGLRFDGTMTINGGTLTAAGGTQAIHALSGDTSITLPAGYIYRTNTATTDPGSTADIAVPPGSAFSNAANPKFVRINLPGIVVNGVAYYTVPGIQEAIRYQLSLGSAAVTGFLHGAAEDLELTIPAGKMVSWEAVYGTTQGISLAGSGLFIVSNGGTVSSTGTGPAIRAGDSTVVAILDGTVTGNSGGTSNLGAVSFDGDNAVAILRSGTALTQVELTTTDLAAAPAGAIARWSKGNGTQNGIYYERGTNSGFISLPGVTVISETNYGLIFDVVSGKFYLNVSGGSAVGTNPEYTPPAGTASWDSGTNTLTLNGFTRATPAPDALIIVGGALTIELTGINGFISTYNGTDSTRGIWAANGNLTITGTGSLEAKGGTTTGASSSEGIAVNGSLTINGGSVTAVGQNSAITTTTTPGNLTLPSAYKWWSNTAAADPGGAGTLYFSSGGIPSPGSGAAYIYSASDRYIKIESTRVDLNDPATNGGGGGCNAMAANAGLFGALAVLAVYIGRRKRV